MGKRETLTVTADDDHMQVFTVLALTKMKLLMYLHSRIAVEK